VQLSELTDGTRLWLDARERTEAGPFWNGVYEEHDVAMLQASLRPGGDYVDVGAHVGLLALRLARAQLRNGGRVVAIEPLHANAERLRRSVGADPVLARTITVVECAVGATDGVVALLGERPGDTGNAAVVPTRSQPVGSVTVPMCTLDAVLANFKLDRIDAIKLDVEGYECNVLRGAHETIERERPVVFGEFAPDLMPNYGASFADVLDQFSPRDYRFFTQTLDGRFQEHEEPTPSLAYVILVPRERADEWCRRVGFAA
jgi:FkbM family methyltransferase